MSIVDREECLRRDLKEFAENVPAPKNKTFILDQDEGVMSRELVSGNSGKAGLPSSLDEINSRIAEASKDSRFTLAQERKNVELEAKMKAQREQLLKAVEEQPHLVSKAKRMVDSLMKEFDAGQVEQFSKSDQFCWVCVDMDAFYASVECLDQPDLKDVPMAVGSSSMLSTANYEARKFGVSAAMPGYIAQKLCPQLKIVPLRFERYRELSAKVEAILREYADHIQMWSLDEAFMKISKDQKDFADVVREMREDVKRRTGGLTCSAGIACNPLLAKLASNFRKPDGQFEINRVNVLEMRQFLHSQPVRKLSGIGKVMSLTLEKVFDVKTVGDLYEQRHRLPLIFKEKTVKSLLAKCIGHCEDFELVDPTAAASTDHHQQKSVSCERTFQPSASIDMHELLKDICDNLWENVEEMKVCEVGRVGIKVKSSDFRVFTREKAVRLSVASGFTTVLYENVTGLLTEFMRNSCEYFEPRLLGVRLTSLKYPDTRNNKRGRLDDWLNPSVSVKCPVCSMGFRDENDLVLVNEHIDECLTKFALREEKKKENV